MIIDVYVPRGIQPIRRLVLGLRPESEFEEILQEAYHNQGNLKQGFLAVVPHTSYHAFSNVPTGLILRIELTLNNAKAVLGFLDWLKYENSLKNSNHSISPPWDDLKVYQYPNELPMQLRSNWEPEMKYKYTRPDIPSLIDFKVKP